MATGRPREVASPLTGPLRVLIVIRSLGPGGAERLVLDQIRHRDAQAFAYELFVARERDPNLLDEAESLEVPIHLGYESERSWPVALRQLLAHRGFDVVHSHLPVAAAGARLAALSLDRPRRPRLIYTEHNRWPSYRLPTRWANRFTIHLEDQVLAVSRDAADSVGWPARRPVEVLEHGVELASIRNLRPQGRPLRAELGLPTSATLIGTVANLRREKAQDGLLRAFAGAGFDDTVALVLVGQGPLRKELEREIQRLGLTGRAHLLGYRSDAVELVSQLDVFTLPSAHEGRPVALMEAMAAGIPAVVTPAGGVVDMVEDGRSGLVVPIGDEEALAAALRRVVEHDGLRSTLARGAAEAADAFDCAHAFGRIEAHYRRLARGRRAPG